MSVEQIALSLIELVIKLVGTEAAKQMVLTQADAQYALDAAEAAKRLKFEVLPGITELLP